MTDARFSPRIDYWESRARESFAKQGAMKTLGAQIVSIEPGRCALEAPFKPELSQQHGYFHAGVTSALADTAGGYAAYTLFADNSEVLTVEFKINLIAPAKGRAIVAEARVIQPGRTLTVCTIEVRVRNEERETVCAIMQQTLMRIEAVAGA